MASRGFANLKPGLPDAAIADYDAEIQIDPGNSYTLFGRGLGKRLKGDLSGGDADVAAAKKINTGIAEAMVKLGVRL